MTELERIRHSAAHVLATAILKIWPEAQFAAGPPVENGFYYDVELPHRISPEDFARIEEEMKKEIKANHVFERVEISRADAIAMAERGELAALATPFRQGGSVTAGNASGVNDGAAAVFIASAEAVQKYGLTPRARIVSMATVGVPPRIMGIGPAPATQALLDRHGLKISDIDMLEVNEAFAAQALASLRQLGLPDDADHVNPHGGAIALGHPLGMSGARLAISASLSLGDMGGKRAICSMCIGVGQGIALMMEAV